MGNEGPIKLRNTVIFVGRMKTNLKIQLLIGSCVIIVGTLSLIQYYLVLNTYKLTKEKYYTEVKEEMEKIIDLPSNNLLEEKAQENLKFFARLYVKKEISKKDFMLRLRLSNDSLIHKANQNLLDEIKSKPSLKSIRFKSQYDEILVTFKDKTDTLLSNHDEPFIFLGTSFQTPNTLLISNGNNIIVDNLPSDNQGLSGQPIKLKILRSQYIDVSSWEGEVWKRMAGIYLLAILLIIAVILLFYLVFRAMLRQKKLAEIKTDFANNITHELKTPLSSVNLILRSLERDDVRSNPALTDELLSSLKRQYIKIRQVVDFVLESAMSSDYQVNKEPINIGDYLNDYIRDLKIEAHLFTHRVSAETQVVLANIQVLDKILNNLIENAIKYSPEGTRITLNSHKTADKYVIEILDEGPGIPAEDQPFIFDKFFRVTENNKHSVKGLGLGLYLSKQAANAINANLFLKSKPGHGATFILELKNEQ